ncbi:MAG: signal peptide protein [Verrucomicrobiales bacterium]|nr:signal peptide protein [Verrucomicrobiales bacterium]
MKHLTSLLASLLLASLVSTSASDRVSYAGKDGPGKGKKVVLISGDEEYRSEEGLPMLGKILAVRHGFNCTVLFPLDTNGVIDPNIQTNIPGFEELADADMVIVQLRFRELPDDKMKYFADYLNAGKPILGLRTATHSFAYSRNKTSPYAKFDWQSREWPGGFGQQVLGDTWISHHGNHGSESTRAVFNDAFKNHPLMHGVSDVWGPTDVYGVAHLPKDANVLMYGEVVAGMKPTDARLDGKKNDPMMPIAWFRNYKTETGNTSKIVTTTMGAATDLLNEGLRRFVVNACYWGTNLEVPAKADVNLVGDYAPTAFGFNKAKKGIKPDDHKLN